MGVRIVKRDVGGERVNKLVLIHARIVRGFRVWIRHFSFSSFTNRTKQEGDGNGERNGTESQAESYSSGFAV